LDEWWKNPRGWTIEPAVFSGATDQPSILAIGRSLPNLTIAFALSGAAATSNVSRTSQRNIPSSVVQLPSAFRSARQAFSTGPDASNNSLINARTAFVHFSTDLSRPSANLHVRWLTAFPNKPIAFSINDTGRVARKHRIYDRCQRGEAMGSRECDFRSF
jgi:hypothetical protein